MSNYGKNYPVFTNTITILVKNARHGVACEGARERSREGEREGGKQKSFILLWPKTNKCTPQLKLTFASDTISQIWPSPSGNSVKQQALPDVLPILQ